MCSRKAFEYYTDKTFSLGATIGSCDDSKVRLGLKEPHPSTKSEGRNLVWPDMDTIYTRMRINNYDFLRKSSGAL